MQPKASAVNHPPKFERLKESLVVSLGLLCVAFLGHYLYVKYFGLYEDDYYFTIQPYVWNWATLKAYLFDAWHSWPQFRPLGFSITYLITYATAQFDSLLPAYGVGLLLNALDGYLLYLIATRLARRWIAFLVACIFILYPSDTSKTILMLRGFELANLAMVLSAILLYLRGQRFLSYILAAGCLLTYEHFFLPFLVAPFVAVAVEKFRIRRLAWHWGFCALLPGLLMVARKLAGDQRSTAVIGAPMQALYRVVSACVIGPKTALTALIDRPMDALLHSGGLQWVMILLTTAMFAAIAVAPKHGRTRSHAADGALLWAIAGAAVCGMLGYVIAILPDNYPPIVNIGRLSGFNAPASVSICLLFAGMLELAVRRLPRLEPGLIPAAGLYAGLLVSFGIQIQRTDYAASWGAQRQFWQTVLASSGEWKPGIPVLVDIDVPQQGSYNTIGFPINWIAYDALMGTQAFISPETWSHWMTDATSGKPTCVFAIFKSMSWKKEGPQFLLDTPPGFSADRQPLIGDHGFILFGFRKGVLTRLDDPLILGTNMLYPIPAPQTPQTPASFSRLSRILFSGTPMNSLPAAKIWPSILRARSYPR